MSPSPDADDFVLLYDSTLRDGAQTMGVDFSAHDKRLIAEALDRLGLDHVEAGWPGANDTDTAVFADPPRLVKARLTAFGMTRRAGRSASNDPGLAALLDSGAAALTLVGKSWDFQATTALGVTPEENLVMIGDSIAHLAGQRETVMFDAEHFFDGYRANPDYALACLRAAHEAGAAWLVLCDTNGGMLPHEVEAIVGAVRTALPEARLGIHCHNDTGNAVANSLAAVRAGARQVQGTLNGLGERCGNADLVAIIPALVLKMGYRTSIDRDGLRHLTSVSRFLDERLNRTPNRHAPYVGESAFAHKGGLHASAVAKDPRCYEHIDPALVGNRRQLALSNQAGRANLLDTLRQCDIETSGDDPRVTRLLETVKRRENEGYSYEGALGSFCLMARRHFGEVPTYFTLTSFRVIDERRWNARGDLITLSEATVKAHLGDELYMAVAEGNGPVNALDKALRKVLAPAYPVLKELTLVDYKVRIIDSGSGTGAKTRVMIESIDHHGHDWTTVGVSTNVIDASYEALQDAIVLLLLRDGASPKTA